MTLIKTWDIDYLDKFPVYTIFILLLIISANFLSQLFPCRFQEELKNNIYLKHLFAFMTLFFFVIITAPLEEKPIDHLFGKSILIYIWFLLFIRTSYPFFLLLLGIFIVIYFFVLKKTYYTELYKNKEKDKNNKKDNFENISDQQQKNIDIDFYDSINHYLLIFSILITILGFFIYLGEVKHLKKNKFNFIKFIFGHPDCGIEPSKLTPLQALNYAFTKF